MKKQKITAGSIVKIPIDDSYHTYGRLLFRPFIEVYDCKTQVDQQDLNEIVRKPVLFVVSVYDYTINDGHWEKIGKLPFDESQMNIPKQFVQDDLYLTDCQLVDAYGNMERTTISACRGREAVAVWDPEHVEERLRDHYAGRPNTIVEMLKVKELPNSASAQQHPRNK